MQLYFSRSRAVVALAFVILANAAAADQRPVVEQPYLRDNLPQDTLVYVRLPDLLGFFSAPKGTHLDPVMRSAANQRILNAVRSGLATNVLAAYPEAGEQLEALAGNVRSPLEFAFVAAPAPSLLIAATLDFESMQDFEIALARLLPEESPYYLAEPLTDDGRGVVAGVGAPLHFRFDAGNGRLLVNAGPAVSPESFDKVLARMSANDTHPLRRLERRIDADGNGLFFWIDSQRALPFLQMFVAEEKLKPYVELGLDKLSAAAFGYGVANGRARMSLLGELPADIDRGYFPIVRNELSATAVSEPTGLVLLSIPSVDEFTRMEHRAANLSSAESLANWAEFKEFLDDELDFSIEDLVGAIGPDVYVISDDVGDYGALRIRNRSSWRRILGRLTDRLDWQLDRRRIDGRDYFHLATPSEVAVEIEDDVNDDIEVQEESPVLQWFTDIAARQREHVYWTHEGEFLYFAGSPQVLIDRSARAQRVPLKDWLQSQPRMDASATLFGAYGSVDKLPRRTYSLYLDLLNILGAVADVEVDLWSMPTADQLRLPKNGAMGAALNFSDSLLAVEMSFSNNPFEAIGGAGGAMMLGIAAAIAVPAYQDYRTRAQVSAVLTVASGARAEVTRFYAENRRFPDEPEAAAMAVSHQSDEWSETSLSIQADTGTVIVEVGDKVVAGGGFLFFEAQLDDESLDIDWQCTSTIEDKYLPAACR